MCGIVSVISAFQNGFTQNEVAVFSDLLLADTLRGKDSTGVFSITSEENVHILKSAINGASFVNTKEYKAFSDELFMDGIFAVGHNRAATRGDVTDENAHPFNINDKIVLVQNGTWFGDHKKIKDTAVDTEALAHIIHDHPDDVEAALQKIEAAYALMWYNVDKKTLYAIRNSQRPLWMAETAQGGTILASEKNLIIFACGRNNIILKKSPEELEVGHLYSWQLDNGKYIPEKTKVDYIPRTTNSFYDPDWYDWKNKNTYYPPWVTQHSKSFYSNDNKPLHKSLDTLVMEGVFADYEMSEENADELISNSSTINLNSVYLEAIDYVQATIDSTDSNKWYLVFSLISTENSKQLCPVIHKYYEGKSEIEMMEMVGNMQIQEANIGYYRKIKNNNTNQWVVVSYVVSMHDMAIQ